MFKDREYKFFLTSKVFSLLRLVVIVIALSFFFEKIILIINKAIELRIYTTIIILALFAFLVYQRKSDNTKVENMSDYIKQLELIKDQKRSSSNLTKQGDTNPLDK